jgi:hypothetical protein
VPWRFDFGEILSACFGQRGLLPGDRRVLDYLDTSGLRFERLLALPLCRECELSVVDWIKEWVCPVGQTDADFHCATPVG